MEEIKKCNYHQSGKTRIEEPLGFGTKIIFCDKYECPHNKTTGYEDTEGICTSEGLLKKFSLEEWNPKFIQDKIPKEQLI